MIMGAADATCGKARQGMESSSESSLDDEQLLA
jgi:hypothetical protein